MPRWMMTSSLRSSSVVIVNNLDNSRILSMVGSDSPDSHLEMDWRDTPKVSANFSWETPLTILRWTIFSASVINSPAIAGCNADYNTTISR